MEKNNQRPQKEKSRSGNQNGGNRTRNTVKNNDNRPKKTIKNAIKKNNTNNNGKRNTGSKGTLKIIPLGGLNEIGKNITAFEYNNTILILDCGMSFPEDEMFGIDIVIPDFEYLEKNSSKIKGMILTHGHEDHIGAIPYLLKRLNVPIYGTKLTIGLVRNKLSEHNLKGNLNNINAGDKLTIGPFDIEAIRTTHSIADSLCFAIDTPVGMIFHTGDFKVDYTPVDGEPIDFQKLAEIGKKGVLVMMADSTNAIRKGFTASEGSMSNVLDKIFHDTKSRIIVATFASNVHRIQSIINTSVANGRKVALSGRSMLNVLELGQELGYIKIPKNMLVDVNETKNIPDSKLTIITTGSQGEPMSALARMASDNHRAIKIKKGDTVILSSSPVPGNEKTVANVVNRLFERGAEVIYSDIADIHVSGHACEEEIKLLLSLIKPKFYMPVHGEYRHLYQNATIAESLGMKTKNIFILENGQILKVQKNKAEIAKETVEADPVFVDGLGVGDVGDVVINDRRLLSESGLIAVAMTVDKSSGELLAEPEVFSRGFVYVKKNEHLLEEAKGVVLESLRKSTENKIFDYKSLKGAIIKDLRRFIYDKTQRNPVILPIFMEI